MSSNDGRIESKVKWFNEGRGIGFIQDPENLEGPDIFVHYSAIAGSGFRTLKEGERVAFEMVDGPKGKQAVRVERLP